jgi:energy-coupling factor transporter ATP-binding protein EcfA2
MRDADILILDEPTAALDAYAECELFQRVRASFGQKIVILISWEIPRLCRGGSRSLTYPAGRAPAIRCEREPLEARLLILRKGELLTNGEAIPKA